MFCCRSDNFEVLEELGNTFRAICDDEPRFEQLVFQALSQKYGLSFESASKEEHDVAKGYRRIFGEEYGVIGEDTSMNVYAFYDLNTHQICDNLSIVIKHPAVCDEERQYSLSAQEKDMFLRKMDQYCMQQTGDNLMHWHEHH